MKRKLIKRNKKFLSSKYQKYGNGNFTFQPMVGTAIYDNGDVTVKTTWMWFYSEKWVLDTFYGGSKRTRDTIFLETLAEITAIDQELGLYD